MSTESIEREIKLSYEAYEKVIKIMNEPVKDIRKRDNNILEELAEGNRILEKLFKSEER